ncbi:MAG TPA: hypothetical protein VEY89_13945, partial [Candidatus Dormibacteraeota bacterium]|nr:hypothetical protein [Candidatus Dormibacteraeota bacterium]
MRAVVVQPDGARHSSLLGDEGLGGLADAATASVITPWLRDLLGSDIESCVVTPVRYRPGRRCVLRYDVATAGGPAVLFGKVLPTAEAAELAAILTALGPGFTARVAGIAPQWGLVVQADTGGNSLSHIAKGAVSTDDLVDVTAAAHLLAHLHARTDPQAPVRTLQRDAEDVMEFIPACKRFAPGVARRLGDVAASAAAQPGGGSTAPAHGAFRLDQVHTTASAPVLIDIDSYCFAEPERDLGNLLAYLDWRALRRPGVREGVREVRHAFLDGYQQASRRGVDLERLGAYEAVSLLKIAGRRYPRLKSS